MRTRYQRLLQDPTAVRATSGPIQWHRRPAKSIGWYVGTRQAVNNLHKQRMRKLYAAWQEPAVWRFNCMYSAARCATQQQCHITHMFSLTSKVVPWPSPQMLCHAASLQQEPKQRIKWPLSKSAAAGCCRLLHSATTQLNAYPFRAQLQCTPSH
jgi:hypothetical protein